MTQCLQIPKDRELHIIGLCNNLKLLCEAKGIKLLFTAMSEKCIPNVDTYYNHFTKKKKVIKHLY